MSNKQYYLDQFRSETPEIKESIPVKLPNGEKFEVFMDTNNEYGLDSIEAVGLYSKFEFNWSNYYGDFVMSGLMGKTRYIWAVLKQDSDCGIVTFHMDKGQHKLAEFMLQDMAMLIEAKHLEHMERTTGEA